IGLEREPNLFSQSPTLRHYITKERCYITVTTSILQFLVGAGCTKIGPRRNLACSSPFSFSAFGDDCKRVVWSSEHFGTLVLILRTVAPKLRASQSFGGRAMFLENAIRVPKALTTFAVSLVFFLAALPAHAQDQYRILWIGHPVMIIVGLILV